MKWAMRPRGAHRPFLPPQPLTAPSPPQRAWKEKERNAMSKVKKGHSAGEYRTGLKHGVSNQFQDRWLQENERHLWLEYHGMDVQGVYKAKCKWCETVFNCHIGTIKIHEQGVKH